MPQSCSAGAVGRGKTKTSESCRHVLKVDSRRAASRLALCGQFLQRQTPLTVTSCVLSLSIQTYLQETSRNMPQQQYTREEQFDMLAKLRKQVEFYFSPQNLAHDTFLRSLLEKHGENGVPVEMIATFHRVKALYEVAPWLPTLLRWAMTNSLIVSVSEDCKWIRPILACPIILVCSIPVSASSVPGNTTSIPWDEQVLHSKQSVTTAPSSSLSQSSSAGDPIYAIQMKERTTVILLDVPDGCDFEEVMEVFSTDSVKPTSAYRDFGNTWNINFATEAQAVAGVSATRDRNIRGQAIRAGIKSERTMATLPKREGFTAQPTFRPLLKSLKDLGIPIPANETLRMPQLYEAPVQQLNVPQYGYYPMAPYSDFPPYDMNAFWPYGVPEMTQQFSYSNAMWPHYPYTYPQQAPPVPYSGPGHVSPGYAQQVNNPRNKKKPFLKKKSNKGVYQNRYWKIAIGEPNSKHNEPRQATIQNNRRQGSEPNAVNALSQADFPALIDNVATSRRTQSALDYVAALLNSPHTSLH